jgi:prepilin-type processing-associated H-X9-DG protein
LNNLKQLSLAALTFESANGTFPGYQMGLSSGTGTAIGMQVNWSVFLMPYVERTDIWNAYRSSGTSAFGSGTTCPSVALFSCPSDPPTGGSDPAGKPITGPSSYQANGWVFQNQLGLSLDGIPDGTSLTLMLSENLQTFTNSSSTSVSKAHGWATLETTSRSGTPTYVQTFGCGKASPIVVGNSGSPFTYPTAMTDNLEANHTGGVNAAFCDGHAIFLRTDLDAMGGNTFEQLVNPNDNACGTNNPPLSEQTFSPP